MMRGFLSQARNAILGNGNGRAAGRSVGRAARRVVNSANRAMAPMRTQLNSSLKTLGIRKDLNKFVDSFRDGFSEAAFGAKLPVGTHMATAPFRMKELAIPIVCGAKGQARLYLAPCLANDKPTMLVFDGLTNQIDKNTRLGALHTSSYGGATIGEATTVLETWTPSDTVGGSTFVPSTRTEVIVNGPISSTDLKPPNTWNNPSVDALPFEDDNNKVQPPVTARIVSCTLRIKYTGTNFNRAGRVYIYVDPLHRCTARSSISAVSQWPYLITVDVAKIASSGGVKVPLGPVCMDETLFEPSSKTNEDGGKLELDRVYPFARDHVSSAGSYRVSGEYTHSSATKEPPFPVMIHFDSPSVKVDGTTSMSGNTFEVDYILHGEMVSDKFAGMSTPSTPVVHGHSVVHALASAASNPRQMTHHGALSRFLA